MSKELIESELSKNKPNWLLISDLAKELYKSNTQTNPLGFKKGFLNIIKTSEYNVSDILKELEICFNSNEYKFLMVGGYSGMTVTKYNKILPTLKNLDKYIVIVTNKDQVYTNSSTKGFECNIYKSGIRNKYDTSKKTSITITGDGVQFKAELNSLRAELRGTTLDSILN
jgi:hypothetical protein